MSNADYFMPIDASKPFLLNLYDGVFLIQSGQVDLFAVKIEQGKPVGARSYLFSLKEDNALFGLKSYQIADDYGLLVAGRPGTSLLRLQDFVIRQLAETEEASSRLVDWIEFWVDGLSRGIAEAIAPKASMKIEKNTEFSVYSDTILSSPAEVLWLKPREGAFEIMGYQDLPAITQGHLFPIAPSTWIKSLGECRAVAIDTQALVQQDLVWKSMDGFHEFMLTCIGYNLRKSIRFEAERLKKKSRADQVIVEKSLSNVISLINPDTARPFSEKHSQKDALVLCCKEIGKLQGIQVASTFETPKNEQLKRDPLDIVAKASKFRTRRVMLRGKWWMEDNGPLLGYWGEQKQPVAILPALALGYELYDPTKAKRVFVTKKIADQLSPFAFMFYRPFPEELLTAFKILRFGRHGSFRDLFLILMMGFAGGLLGMVLPIVTGMIFDSVIPGAQTNQLFQLSMALLASGFALFLFGLTRSMSMLRLEAKMGNTVQSAVWDRLLNLPSSFFRKYSVGDLSDRTNGIIAIQQTLTGAVFSSILGGVFGIFNFTLLFYYDSTLAWIASLLVSIMVVVTVVVGALQIRFQRFLLNQRGKITGMLLQFISSVSKIRVAGAEDYAFAAWSREFVYQKKLAFQSGLITHGFSIFNETFPMLSSMTIFAVLSSAARQDPLSTGHFLAFNAAFGSFQGAVLSMAGAIISILSIVPMYERSQPILETLPEVNMDKGDPGELTGDIEINHISFRYNATGTFILRDISLTIKPGEFVAFVGPSGSGKSSLLRLMLGFELPESGSIYYDNHDLATLDMQALRRQLGVVLQHGKLMAGDIYSNIVGASGASLDDALEAARMAGFDEDIKQMPMGIHTIVSEGGTTLSGGQRQRLLIARGLVHKPKILFFDEATSALDNRTQSIVTQNLEKLKITRVIIAHRLSTIMNADRIYVFQGGKIAQRGT
ncbi:MAG: NHLP bacteriocin export ABC transporter permease/ATPase subunit, partial [SAR324 cluster bacterium]|nr:NHLP bacteriocin export ABC transporter permease/ATPase subunit [SAR324 cluster bacterium]